MLLLPANTFTGTHALRPLTCMNTTVATLLPRKEYIIEREERNAPQTLNCHIAFSSQGQIRCYKNMQPPWKVQKPQDWRHSCQDDTCPILEFTFTLFAKAQLDKHLHHRWKSYWTNSTEHWSHNTTFRREVAF